MTKKKTKKAAEKTEDAKKADAVEKTEDAKKADAVEIKAIEEAALKQVKAAGLDAEAATKHAQEEGERKRGKLAARKQLLVTTRKVRMIRDAPTSKGRMLTGAVVRLPNHEADRLKAALPPLVQEL